jgi:hypothetical protein
MKRARFKSADHGNDAEIKPLWQALYAAGADVVINGQNHDYERFAPQDPDGNPDSQQGIREFLVGTDGKNSHVVLEKSDPTARAGRLTHSAS